jgi:hypothetical protein
MIFARKPESPAQALSSTLPEDLMVGKQEGGDSSRTRPPLQNYGTWGDVVYPGCHHTSDPKAPSTAKAK